MVDRILWNERPERPGGGDIDEIVMHNVDMVHIEQMDDRCWWIALYPERGSDRYWMGNFVADSRGRMRFVEQENAGIEWDRERSHEDDRVDVLPVAGGRNNQMRFQDAIRNGLAAKREKQAEANASEQRKVRKAAGRLRRRQFDGPPHAPICHNCGDDPMLGCSDCPPGRFGGPA